MPRCAATGCNNNGNHSFPKDLRIRRLWEKALKRRNFKAKNSSRLCSEHFIESDYEGVSSSTGLPQVHRYLKKTAIPTVFAWKKPTTAASIAREQRYLKRNSRKKLVFPSTSATEIDTNIPSVLEDTIEVLSQVPDFQVEVELMTSPAQEIRVAPPPSTPNTVSTQTPHLFRFFSSDDMLSDARSILFYTGLEDIAKFNLVFSTLLPMAHHLNYRGSQVINISVMDQFLLMLVKLRRNKPDFEMAKMFGISTTAVGNIFVTWVNFVYELWKKIDIWPSRSLVNYYMPDLFKQYHPATRVIIDSTEIPISKPKNPTAQQATFSSYKHHNTIKFLVGATPGGLISFCSDGYAGSTSDRQITERSSLLAVSDEKDAIMADRGFDVQDLFEQKDVAIYTPTFLKGLSQLPGVKLKHDRQLARNRIHIERLIGLTKTFKILKSDVNSFYVPLLSRIFFICVMLCNFKEGIVI
ncbi:unnamed protein product [Euphydryas editha]|uniref:THAP-type domain-containing protein n=1 Tax=Euphydryas editha TaxID=104508 RepID=A0AAU9TN03_EUPED|nr:unnamed protein product [Euphydryas editha]